MFKISTDLFQVRHGSLSLQTNTRKNKQTRKCKQTVPNVVSYKKRRTKKSRKKYSRKFQEKSRKFLKIPGNSRKLQVPENSRKILGKFQKFQQIPEKKSWKKILETSWKKILRKTYLIRSLVQAADELCSRFF